MLLILSILALFLGPFTYRLLQRQPGWLDLLDAFIFVTISGLVLFHILPEVLHEGGLIVLVLMALGLLAPSWVEKYFHKAAHQAHQMTLFLGVLGLVLHASIDGSALNVEMFDHTGWLLALGVLLHRFPVGLTVWWLLRPQYGRLLPLAILSLMSLATLLGALFSEYSLSQLDGQWLAWFQAFVMGSIMHVVLHRPYLKSQAPREEKENKYAAGIGSVVGLIVLGALLLPHWLGYASHDHAHGKSVTIEQHQEVAGVADHDHHDELHEGDEHDDHHDELHEHNDEMHEGDEHTEHHDEMHENDAHEGHQHAEKEHKTALTLANFIQLALYTAPLLLLAYFLSALMHYFKPTYTQLPKQDSSSFAKDSTKGLFYGLALPVCSAQASKMYQQLLASGVNQTFAIAFLIATPIIAFDSLLISLPLLSLEMVGLRVLLGATFAFLIAYILGRHFKNTDTAQTDELSVKQHSGSRFLASIKQGYLHQLDHTAPWVLLGWALAATLSANSAWAFFDQALWLQVLVMILVAFPFSLCATGVTPVIALLLMAGLSPGAGMAFLLIAPTISLELLSAIKKQQGIFAAISLLLFMFGLAFLIGLGMNQFMISSTSTWFELHQGDYSWWQYLSLALILVLYFVSLLRRGARDFIAELIPQRFLKGHDHDHHHHHHH
ncbi:permease [Psychromonas sp. CNPT3]|uniref:permease n=1 Tax=Psychromonas sp. CNPT3 TaxID=314282 RepID=UPI00006E70B0|nr:permease [Psychromonas sp. CNPT3]AGH80065.1 permease [Psychromonas sp. CNPT3]